MKDRLITVAGGLLALALVVMLLVPAPDRDPDEISRPVSADRGRNGLQGLVRWLEGGRVPTETLRRRYGELDASLDRPPRGNLLIVSLPQRTASRDHELAALHEWIARGNSVLVLSAAGDVPRWSIDADHATLGRLPRALGFTFHRPRRARDDDDEAAEQRGEQTLRGLVDAVSGKPIELAPLVSHPVTRGVERVAARSVSFLDEGWHLHGHDEHRAVLSLLAGPDDVTALWEARIGEGRMWFSRYADLFGNVSLGEADNARLIANMVSIALGPGGRVILDDMHQGVSDLYDPAAFFSDPRLFATLGFVTGFWLLYLVGSSQRLALPRPRPARYYAAELAGAMGDLFVRRISTVTLARQLFAHFFDDIRSRYGLPTNGEPVWTLLRGMSQVSRDDVRELEALHDRAAAGTRVDPIALARALQRTRNSLS
ncbi:MAG: DUF4350 domain-containing protein [Gammaproteobacteria bacterium]|nr:DUF4350 domain-containing protein [Gammaproteobacteria bacterium]